jgi:hypothetical protein
MEVLRVPPFPLRTMWDTPAANTNYIIYIEDLVDHSYENIPVVSDINAQVEYTIPRAKAQFDRKFLFQIKDAITSEVLVDSNLDVLRPYVDPSALGTTASEIKEYKTYELMARSIIDSIIDGGFYNKKFIIQRTGEGTDYFAVWDDVNRILKAYENDILVYDKDAIDPTTNMYEYRITLDNSAVYRIEPTDLNLATPQGFNRAESSPLKLPRGQGDLVHGGYRLAAFPRGFDYLFICDAGYKAIPPDVELAATILVEDLKCGKLDYYKKFVTNYSTDNFKMQFDKRMLDGTGNNIVDKILDNYVVNIIKPGVF